MTGNIIIHIQAIMLLNTYKSLETMHNRSHKLYSEIDVENLILKNNLKYKAWQPGQFLKGRWTRNRCLTLCGLKCN